MKSSNNNNVFALINRRASGYSNDHELQRLLLRNLRCIISHEDRNLADVKLSKDGTAIVSGYHDGTIEIWYNSRVDLELASTIRTGNPVITVAISEDGTVISCHQNGDINQWDIKGINRSCTPHNDQIILLSQNGNTGVVGLSQDEDDDMSSMDADMSSMHVTECEQIFGGCYLKGIYHLKTKAKTGNLINKTRWCDFSISQNGNAAVFLGLGGITTVWTLNHITNQIQCQVCTHIRCLDSALCSAISECGNIIISGHVTMTNASYIIVWDRLKDSYLDIPCSSPPCCLMIQGNIITSGHYDGTVCVWTFDIFRRTYERLFVSSEDDKPGGEVERLSIAGDNLTILSCDRHGFIKIWEPERTIGKGT